MQKGLKPDSTIRPEGLRGFSATRIAAVDAEVAATCFSHLVESPTTTNSCPNLTNLFSDRFRWNPRKRQMARDIELAIGMGIICRLSVGNLVS